MNSIGGVNFNKVPYTEQAIPENALKPDNTPVPQQEFNAVESQAVSADLALASLVPNSSVRENLAKMEGSYRKYFNQNGQYFTEVGKDKPKTHPAFDRGGDYDRTIAIQQMIKKRINQTLKENPIDLTNREVVLASDPKYLLKPQKADNVKGKGISFNQAPVKDLSAESSVARRIEFADTVAETIKLNREKGIPVELVTDANGEYFLGIKNIWDDRTTGEGYFRIDRESAAMYYGDRGLDDWAPESEWFKQNQKDGKVKDFAVVANDEDAWILFRSYVDNGEAPINFNLLTEESVHKDKNATVNAVGYAKEREFKTLEGPITTAVTMGDVSGNAYNKYAQLKKQVGSGKLVANPNDPNSEEIVRLLKGAFDCEKQAKKAQDAEEKAKLVDMAAMYDKQAMELLIKATN